MTVNEFRYEFDLLYNNIMSDMAPGLDDYEVSLFLTKAQQEIVIRFYAGSTLFDGFENAERVRRNLANLIVNAEKEVGTPIQYGKFFEWDTTITDPETGELDPRFMVLISERAKIVDSECCNNEKWVNVVPTKYDELNKVLENPFRMPSNRQVLRLDKTTNDVRLISKEQITYYGYDYLRRPEPIILSDLPNVNGEQLTIDGEYLEQTCLLDESLHRTIIKHAVQLAAASWAKNNQTN